MVTDKELQVDVAAQVRLHLVEHVLDRSAAPAPAIRCLDGFATGLGQRIPQPGPDLLGEITGDLVDGLHQWGAQCLDGLGGVDPVQQLFGFEQVRRQQVDGLGTDLARASAARCPASRSARCP